MFCMNCGQALPDGAKFCMKCGTSLGAVSPEETKSTKINEFISNNVFVPAMCPNCSAHMKVDSHSKIARCDSCGTECLVQDAIKALNVRGNVQVGSATINVHGMNIDSLLTRVELMLADGDFESALDKCDTIFDVDPTNGKAYLYMLLASLHCKEKNDLAKISSPFNENQYYIKALQYGDRALTSELQGYNETVCREFYSKLNSLKPGSELDFGSFERREIRWRVINTRPDMACIMATDVLFDMPFHNTNENVIWRDSTLRKWLNSAFYDNCFSSSEKSRIINSQVASDSNFWYSTSSCVQTEDRIFILGISESKHLFSSNASRAARFWWWLRVPGSGASVASFVTSDGRIRTEGTRVDSNGGVRPVMWIKTD